ncbi:transglutaminase-like cysteine peptidase [Methylomicrobium lacus]|uniref:transglutaminase-like cysteine peptidase n=1 Tax=Methylomicrobium lacus TaxID=136992 RepID=UPI0035A9153A
MPIFALIIVLIWLSGCRSLPEAPGISSEELQAIEARYGVKARERVQSWRHAIADNQSQPVAEKLNIANRWFNRLKFEDDSVHWHSEDYWATPIETLATNGGDCEDFSIGKYFTLKELGIDDQCLRLTYVKSLTLNQPHMVLNYQCDGGATSLVLDNIVPEIMPSVDRSDLVPVYSFNAGGLWLAKQQGMGQQVGGSERLSLWTELLGRIARPFSSSRDY